MAFDAGSIVGKLVLDKADFDKAADVILASTDRLSQRMRKFSQDLKYVGRNIQQVSTGLMFMGAGIVAPLIAAFKSAEKYSNDVRREMERLNNAFLQIRISIAESLLPVMHRFSNIIADLAQRWNALSPEVRENILRIAMVSGVVLILIGIVGSLVAKILLLGSALSGLVSGFLAFAKLHPIILAITVGVVALVYAIEKLGIMKPVINALEIAVSLLAIAFNQLAISMAAALEIGLKSVDMMGLLTGKIQKWANDIQSSLAKTNAQLWSQINNIIQTGQGQFSKSYDELKNTINGIKTLFSDLGNVDIKIPQILESIRTISEGVRDGLNKSIRTLMDFGTTAENAISGVVGAMQTMFSDFFYNVFTGQLEDAAEVFAEFGRYILKMIAQIIAQIIVMKLISGITSLFAPTANIAGMGNVLVAPAGYSGFAEGTDSVPYTGMYKLHEGEKVTPRYDAEKETTQPVTIYNMITPEAVAMAMAGREGEGVIVNVINTNSLRNGIVRREVKHR